MYNCIYYTLEEFTLLCISDYHNYSRNLLREEIFANLVILLSEEIFANLIISYAFSLDNMNPKIYASF